MNGRFQINGMDGRGTVYRPRYGAAVARATLFEAIEDTKLAKNSSVTVKINDVLVFTGVVGDIKQSGGITDIAASDAPQGKVTALSYEQTDLKRIIGDILRVAKNNGQINTAKSVKTYVRLEEPVYAALNRVCKLFNLVWRTDPNGLVVIEPSATKGLPIVWGEELLGTGQSQQLNCLLRPDLLPGQTVLVNPYNHNQNFRVGDVLHTCQNACQETQIWAA